MQNDLETVSPDEDIAVASARMVQSRIDCLLVIDDDSALVGILTTTDILAERGRLLLKAGEGEVPSAATVMTSDPKTVRPDDDMVEAVTQMAMHGIRHLPVVSDAGHLVGMLNESELRIALRAIAMGVDRDDADNRKVTSAMSRPRVVRESASIFEVAGHFIDERIGTVAVVDDEERLRGVVSYIDLLRYLLGRTSP